MEKVSILMPTYNVEKFVEQSVRSVLEQTYTNWELIIVDDQSTDETWNIINGFCDSRIKIFRLPENSGSAYEPREKAFHESTGGHYDHGCRRLHRV
jgi:teichuronic acid biosynthesis glycosyltransferase TuaG